MYSLFPRHFAFASDVRMFKYLYWTSKIQRMIFFAMPWAIVKSKMKSEVWLCVSQHQQLDGEPVSDLQAFIMQCKDPPESGRFSVDESSGGCVMCCCSRRSANQTLTHIMNALVICKKCFSWMISVWMYFVAANWSRFVLILG